MARGVTEKGLVGACQAASADFIRSTEEPAPKRPGGPRHIGGDDVSPHALLTDTDRKALSSRKGEVPKVAPPNAVCCKTLPIHQTSDLGHLSLRASGAIF
jgi:hypothetical protein